MATKASTGVRKVTGLCFQHRQWMESKSEERYTQVFLASHRSLLTEAPRGNCSIPVQAPSQPWWLPHLLGVQTVLGDHWSRFSWALVTLAAGDRHSRSRHSSERVVLPCGDSQCAHSKGVAARGHPQLESSHCLKLSRGRGWY